MAIKDLYKKEIDRTLNPAVSADDYSDVTIKAEIGEYVFTDEIINGLYDVLSAIMNHNVSHNGIWINGFFGSGKSHFLKFLGYCINPKYRDDALARFEEAVRERDPFQNEDSRSEVNVADFNTLAAWIRKSTIDIVLFNIGAFDNSNADTRDSFTQIFWHQFNKLRGYNWENLAMARHLEKLLDTNGLFDKFKQRIAEDGFDWTEQSAMLSVAFLDRVLEIAHELMPTISVEPIKKAIIEDKENVSPDAFCRELKEHIGKQTNPNYRLLFFVDEVSQFINNKKSLLLQLQEIVTGFRNTCDDKVWLACTAQQDLSQLMSNVDIRDTSDDYGRIMGRFEVRVSLRGTQTEFITQKRLLDKNDEGKDILHDLYEKKRLAIDNQFILPLSFKSFAGEEDFIDYYPFVPYQFRLMKSVLDAFSALGYIDVQARGNERSVIKITHSTAQSNMNEQVGQFVSFDLFYNSMFSGSLKNIGQKAITNAEEMVREYHADEKFARRVVNILFMICNLTDSDKLLFPATIDYMVTLLMEDVDANRQELITRTEKALAFLLEKHIIRIEKDAETGANIYCFQSEDEMDAEREIAAVTIDNATMAERYKEIFVSHFKATQNRERYCSRDFSIGWSIFGRNSLSNNPDVPIEFAMTAQANGMLFGNDPKVLTFNLSKDISKDTQLKNDFYYYCQVQHFISQGSRTETRQRTINAIKERVLALYKSAIVPKLNAILNRCEVISGNTLLSVAGDGSARYHNAIQEHLKIAYPYATFVTGNDVPVTAQELQTKIRRPVQPGEYGAFKPVTQAEDLIEQYLNQQYGTVYVSEIYTHFKGRPYGWSEVATAYTLNELRRRQLRSFSFNNDPNVETATIATNLLSKGNLFTVTAASAIPQQLINKFIEVWRKVFNTPNVPNSHDAGELFRACKEGAAGATYVSLATAISSYDERRRKISAYPFAAAFDGIIELWKSWKAERDPKQFFDKVIADEQKACALVDAAKVIANFVDDNLEGYAQILAFVKDNKDNFAFLADRSRADELLVILTDENPVPNMRRYAQARDAVKRELEKTREQKRQEIKARYYEVFEELKTICAENEVGYTLNEDNVILQKTLSANLYVLDRELDTTDFRADQVQDIMRRRPQAKPQGGDGTPGQDVPQAPRKVTRMVTLKTGSTKPLKSEADVDAYLAKLKTQLMNAINSRRENEDIMIK